ERSDASAKILAIELAQTHAIIALPARVDITLRAECKRLVEMAKNTFSANSKPFTIDIVINNTAVAFLGLMEEVKEDEFQRNYEVNVLGQILLTGACNFINSKVGTEHTTLYPGTKGTIEAMTRVMGGFDTPEIVEHGARFGGRPAYTSEIAGLIATICNPEFGWCTGSIISANGGALV
ncbi:hypothetical protein N7481_007038, partial [Penicillium waksmanii]|uniref:uncharacterized protein n=1 Tax=Penicillium waksmanii TaxID=69791 RepID=UPI00254900CA